MTVPGTLPIMFDMTERPDFVRRLAKDTDCELGSMCRRWFPDGESYIRLDSPVKGRDVLIACDLDNPDAKLMALFLAADTATIMGARRVGLVAPYLPYMRQDRVFKPGEAVSARIFTNLLDEAFDWMVTVDPHLHRITDLDSVFCMKPITLSAAPYMSKWIKSNVSKPIIIGPDSESLQWASEVASMLKVPYVVAKKDRCGDKCVEIEMPQLKDFTGRTPVIVDDIISTGTTLIETLKSLKPLDLKPPVCVGVHGLQQDEFVETLNDVGIASFVTTNTVDNNDADIDILPLLASGITKFLQGPFKQQVHRFA